MPRPDDPELLDAIYKDVVRGVPLRHAAVRAGISEWTAYQWAEAGYAELQGSQTAHGSRYKELGSVVTFALVVKEAEANCVSDRLSRSDAAEGNNWQKHITVLERRYPKDFGRNQQIQIESNSTVRYVHELGPRAEAAILARREELEALTESGTGGQSDTPTPLLPEATTTTDPDSD